MKDPEVSGEDIDVLTQQYGFDVEAGNPEELLYSPACFEQGLVQWDESMLENPCYDVVGTTLETAVPEYIGCPAASLSEQDTTPLTQQGTLAPADWRSHVTKVKPAPKPAALSTANPMVKGDQGVDVKAHNKRFENSPEKKAAQRAENKAKAAKIMAQQSKSKKKK